MTVKLDRTRSERAIIEVGDIIEPALRSLNAQARVLRSLHGDMVVDTGRRYPDGSAVVVRVSAPRNPGCIVKVTDAGMTLARIGLQPDAPGEHALSVRRDLLAQLSVQEHQGAIMVTSGEAGAGEAIGLLADACLILEAAGIVAKHLRPRETYSLVGVDPDLATGGLP